MLTPAFDFKLEHQVPWDLVTIAKCKFFYYNTIVDGTFPAMAIATTGGKVLIH